MPQDEQSPPSYDWEVPGFGGSVSYESAGALEEIKVKARRNALGGGALFTALSAIAAAGGAAIGAGRGRRGKAALGAGLGAVVAGAAVTGFVFMSLPQPGE